VVGGDARVVVVCAGISAWRGFRHVAGEYYYLIAGLLAKAAAATKPKCTEPRKESR
jgi:hypothetical protein